MRILFADVEGQGDRDATYDARLASAILPVSKCVIFNWRDSLQVDRMLNHLGVMQRAAHNVDLGGHSSFVFCCERSEVSSFPTLPVALTYRG